MPGLRVHGARFRGGNEPCVHRFDCPVGGPFCAASCRVVCTHSLPQETSAGRNLITLFRTVNNFAHFFFRQVGMASPSPVFEARGRTTTTIAARSPTRQRAFRKWLFFRGLRIRIDVRTHSMARSHRCIEASGSGRRRHARHPEKIFGRHPRFASHKPDLREIARSPTTIRSTRTRRIGRRGDTFAMHSMPFVVRPLRDERTTRGGSNDGVERVGHRHSKTRASSIDDAALTGPSRPATRPAPSEKKPAARGGRFR